MKILAKIHSFFKSIYDNEFPPRLYSYQVAILLVGYLLIIGSLLFLFDQLCFQRYFTPSVCCSYIAFGLVFFGFLLVILIRHKLKVHKARLEDHSKVSSLFAEAENVEPRIVNPIKPDNFQEKVISLKKEISDLKALGPEGWTEYRILQLNQMLVDFLNIHNLKARALSVLDDLGIYFTEGQYDIKIKDTFQNK